MYFPASHRFRKITLLLLIVFAVWGTGSHISAQKVRLRGAFDPLCNAPPTSNGHYWNYSDIYGDGNIAVQGSVGNCKGVYIYDITDPDHPVLASHYNPGATPTGWNEAIVIGNRGYFGAGQLQGVHIVDLTDPYHPVLLGVVDPDHGNGFNRVHEMVVWGDYLVENLNSGTSNVLKFIKISNPANPVFIRDFTGGEQFWIHAMHIRGNRMFTSGWGNSFNVRGRTEIYDIGNIETQAPALLGTIVDVTGGTSSTDVHNDSNMHSSWTSEDGNYIYSCREEVGWPGHWDSGDVRVYDIHNPAQPLLVNRIKGDDLGLNASSPHNPVVMGNRLYVSWYEAGLQIFDISDPVHPVRIGQYDTYPIAFDIAPLLRARAGKPQRWDAGICGKAELANSASTGYDGDWAVYPFLGEDRVLAGDMNTGLYILDTSQITAPLKNQVSDFDGDRKTDFSKFTPASGIWQIENSSDSGGSGGPFGITGDKLVAGDYDGDGRSDIAVWRPATGVWYSLGSSNGIFRIIQFGLDGDIPVPGDYDADGRTDIAVWRPANGVWYIYRSTLGINIVSWGMNGDKPLVGDYEGDGKADYTIYRDGTWYVLKSSSSLAVGGQFGLSSDKPLAGDFDGDGKSDFAVYRPSTGVWYVLPSTTNVFTALQFGLPADTPVPADYDGDSKTDIAVFRPNDGNWHVLQSTAGYMIKNFGTAADIPSPSSVNP